MKHTVEISSAPADFIPGEDMLPFAFVRQMKKTLPQGNILEAANIGLRVQGWFTYTGEADAETARQALEYGLTTAEQHLCQPLQVEFGDLFTNRLSELVQEANTCLETSESPVRLEQVVIRYLDWCRHKNTQNQRYMGFVIGASSTHTVVTYAPRGIEGEWQCVCGHYNAPGDACEKCDIPNPGI